MTNKQAVNWLINVRADIGKAEHRELWHYEQTLAEIIDLLSEPERTTGRWIHSSEFKTVGNPYGHYTCDQCDGIVAFETNYCPNCGAKMKGENDG